MLANRVHPFLLAVILDVTDIFPQDNLLYFMAMTGLRNMTRIYEEFKVLTFAQIQEPHLAT